MSFKYLLLQRMRDVENQVFYFCRSVCSLSHIFLAFLHFLFLNVALVVIVWLFTTICFQMRGCKVALVVSYSPLCVFKCFLKALAWAVVKLHWLHLFGFSPLCVFKCVLKLPAWEDAKSHWLHLFVFSPLCFFICVLKFPASMHYAAIPM